MIGNAIIPDMTSYHDGTTSIAGFTLVKTAGNEKMSTWRGTDANQQTVTVTLSQGSAKPTADSHGRVRARIKVVTQVPELRRMSSGVSASGDPIFSVTYVDSIVDVSISVPVSLETPTLDSYAFQVLNAFISASPTVISDASL